MVKLNKEMLTKVISMVIATLLPALVAILTLPLLYNELGEQLFGFYSLILLVIGYVGVLDLGLAKSITYNISKYKNEKSELLSTGIIFSFGIGIIIMFISLMIINIINKFDIVHVENNIINMLNIVCLTIPIVIVNGVLRGALEGIERFKFVALVKSINGISIFIIPLVIYKYYNNEYALSYGLLISRIIPLVILSIKCYKEFFSSNEKVLYDIKQKERLMSFGKWYVVIVLLDFFLVYLDKILITYQYGVEIFGNISLINEIATKLPIIIGLILTVYFPILVGMKFKEEINKSFKMISTITTLFYLIIGFIFIFYSEEILIMWISKEFSNKNNILFSLLIFGFCINSISRIPFNYLLALGESKKISKIHIYEAFIYVPAILIVSFNFDIKFILITWIFRNISDLILLYINYRLSLNKLKL